MNICVTSPSLINKPLLYPPIKSTSLPLSKAAFKDRKQFPWKPFIKVSWENYLFFPSCPRSKLYTNNAYNAISKASRSSKPIPISDALRSEISHWLFLATWTGFLPLLRCIECRLGKLNQDSVMDNKAAVAAWQKQVSKNPAFSSYEIYFPTFPPYQFGSLNLFRPLLCQSSRSPILHLVRYQLQT